jgi:predicted ester cyclase
MSTRAKMSLADIALKLRDEQLKAKVVYYEKELETNSELDAITAQVVAELQVLQSSALAKQPGLTAPAADKSQVEIELIGSFKGLLARLFRLDKLSPTIERKIAEASKRFARLFFESELHEKIRGSTTEAKTLRYVEQALFLVLTKSEASLVQQLDAFEYADGETLADSKSRLEEMIKELRNGFLSRTTPELNALVKLLNASLVRFFTQELPPSVGELAWEVVKESRLADAKVRAGYKISSDAFPRFRQAFERRFLERLVQFVEDEMLRHVREKGESFRTETLHFVADPQIFTDVCELVCDAVYDFLYGEGFLDLPADWRARLGALSTNA